ncbi:hypothetical protein MRB53_007257 [Persea americana]|uniref:Uncharacterized protein n=1 Tax=Persea americana TaxID=3435 RepID=A0ACC2MJJ8_PERAE|nr:hypothetical protein MRB53_007257 [Persea americana]
MSDPKQAYPYPPPQCPPQAYQPYPAQGYYQGPPVMPPPQYYAPPPPQKKSGFLYGCPCQHIMLFGRAAMEQSLE